MPHQKSLKLCERGLVLRIRFEGAYEEALRACEVLGLGPIACGELSGAKEHPGAQGTVRDAISDAFVDSDEPLPGAFSVRDLSSEFVELLPVGAVLDRANDAAQGLILIL